MRSPSRPSTTPSGSAADASDSVFSTGPSAAGRLLGVAQGMATSGLDPSVPGGCPLLNTAIEVDDPSLDAENSLYPELRLRTRRAMNDLLRVVRRIVDEGVASGEFIQDVDADAEASLLVATMEGGLLLMRLYDDPHTCGGRCSVSKIAGCNSPGDPAGDACPRCLPNAHGRAEMSLTHAHVARL